MNQSMPASLAVLVMLAGLGLMYWSLSGLGLLKPSTPTPMVKGTLAKP